MNLKHSVKLCCSNCEFVTAFALCILVFTVFLFFFVRCELRKNSLLSTEKNENSFSQECIQLNKNILYLFFPLECFQSNLLQIRRSNSSPISPAFTPPGRVYFPLPLKVQAQVGGAVSLANSVTDCTVYLVLVAIFGLGLLIFGGVGMFCCCSQLC